MSTPEMREMTETESQLAILLVDDDGPFRDRLAQAFIKRGFAVETAGDYEEAVERARTFRPHRAIVDLRMPGRSGLELVRALIELNDDIEVLVLSGYGSITTAVDAIRLGAVNFLPKPADVDDILVAFDRSKAKVTVSEEDPTTVPSLARAEWEHINRVLAECDGNVSLAARRLGIHRRSLQRKLQKPAPE
jgi:two-component system response regulator RegA